MLRLQVMCVSEQSPAVQGTFVSPHQFATASDKGVLTIWRVKHMNATGWSDTSRFVPEVKLRGHQAPVIHMTASQPWSVLISASEDGSAIVWDMNRLKFLRRLVVSPEEVVRATAIDDSTVCGYLTVSRRIFQGSSLSRLTVAQGHIAVMCDYHLHLYTLNGALIASTPSPTFRPEHSITDTHVRGRFHGSVTFYAQDFSRHGPLLALGFESNVSLWRLSPGIMGEPAWSLKEVRRLEGPDGYGPLTALSFIDDSLYAAFPPHEAAAGKTVLYQWSLPEGGARHVPDSAGHECMAGCGRVFGLLGELVYPVEIHVSIERVLISFTMMRMPEPRRFCGGCGGAFCSTDAIHLTGFEMRYCPECRVQLALSVDVISAPASRVGSRRNSMSGML